MTLIQKTRLEAELSQMEVADAIGRSQVWLSQLERGFFQVSASTEAKILRAIKQLVRYRERIHEERLALHKELRLEPGVPTRL